MAGTLVAALLLFGALRQKHSGLYLPIVFANFINIPLPIIYLAFGAEGAAQAILMYIPQGLIIYSLGVYVASGEKDMKQGLRVMLRTPLIYAAILGLVLNLLARAHTRGGHRLGEAAWAGRGAAHAADPGREHRPVPPHADPAHAGGQRPAGWEAVSPSACSPCGCWGSPGVTRSVVLFEAAMPAAVFVSVLAAKYKNEEELVSSVVLATTLMAIVVIPALLYFLT